MTAAPVLSPPDSPYEPPSRRPTWPRWRPALRLAIRDTRAHQGRSALIVALVALPVGLVVGAALWSATRDMSAGGDPVTDGLIPDGVMLGIAVGFVQIVLLAGAAFAVSARRRQRELALLAAAGAEPGDLTRAVIAQALVLGGIGAASGCLTAYLATAVAQLFVAEVPTSTLPILPAFSRALLLVPILGVLACLVASLPAARQVASIPLADTLRSRDGSASIGGPSQPTRILWPAALGALLLAFGLLEVVGYVASSDGTAPSWLIGTGTWALGLGIVASQFGVVLLSPALLALVTRPTRLPLPARLAARDAARNGLRSAFAVAAVSAATALAGASLIWAASVLDAAEAGRIPSLPTDTVLIGADGSDAPPDEDRGSWRTMTETDRQAVADAYPDADVALVGLASLLDPLSGDGLLLRSWCEGRTGLGVARTEDLYGNQSKNEALAANLPDDSTCRMPRPAGTFLNPTGTVGANQYEVPGVVVVEPEDARLLLGQDDPAVRAALAAGSAVSLSPRAVVNGTARVTQTQSWASMPPEGEVVTELPAVVVETPIHPGALLVAPATLAAAGLTSSPNALVVSGGAGGQPPAGYHIRSAGEDTAMVVQAVAEMGPFSSLDRPRGPRDLFGAWAALAFALLATVLVSSLAVSEARRDLSVMGAVGAAPWIRRSFAACSAAIVGLVGSALGILAAIPLGRAGLTALDWAPDFDRCLWVPSTDLPRDFTSCPVPVDVPLSLPWGWLLGLLLLVPTSAALVQFVATRSRIAVPRR